MMKTVVFTLTGAALVAATNECMVELAQIFVCISECDDLSYGKLTMPSCVGDQGGDPERTRLAYIDTCNTYGVDEFKSWYTEYASADDCPEENAISLTAPLTNPPSAIPTYSPTMICKHEYSQEIMSVSSCDELKGYWPECVGDQGGDPARFTLTLIEQCEEYGLEEWQSWYQDCAEDIAKCGYYSAEKSTTGSKNPEASEPLTLGEHKIQSQDTDFFDPTVMRWKAHAQPDSMQYKKSTEGSKRLMERLRGSEESAGAGSEGSAAGSTELPAPGPAGAPASGSAVGSTVPSNRQA